MVEIRWTRGPDDDLGHLVVPGRDPIRDNEDGNGFLAAIDEIDDVSIASLRRAFARCRRWHIDQYGAIVRGARTGVNPRTGEKVQIPITDLGSYPLLELVDVTKEELDAAHDYEPGREPLRLVGTDEAALAVQVEIALDGDEEPDLQALRRLLEPQLKPSRLQLLSVESHAYGERDTDYGLDAGSRRASFWVITVHLAPTGRGDAVRDLLDRGYGILALIGAADGRGSLNPTGVRALIAGGQPELILGLRESSWFDVKGELYPKEDKVEFLKDVAAFANADGGLIVLGAMGQKRLGYEEVARLNPIAVAPGVLQRYRKWVADGIYPRPNQVTVEAWPVDEASALVTIFVPEQPLAMRPFLIMGAERGPRLSAQTVLIPYRHGDDTVYMSREELHASLVAGRAALGVSSSVSP